MEPYHIVTDAEKEQIVKLFQETPHCATVAKALGLNTAQVAYFLKKAGVVGNDKKRFLNNCLRNKALVLQMAKDGKSLSEIGRTVGAHGSKVKKYLSEWMPDWKLNEDYSGSRNSHWSGGRIVDKDGYVLLHMPTHPNCNIHGQIREHRVVMEKKIGRYLTAQEVVHHKDKNKQNNSPDNLELYDKNSNHLRDELTGHVPKWTEDGKRRMQEAWTRRSENQRTRNHRQLEQGVLQLL